LSNRGATLFLRGIATDGQQTIGNMPIAHHSRGSPRWFGTSRGTLYREAILAIHDMNAGLRQ
jgi:hypothetical protein